MPSRAPQACLEPGCPALAQGQPRCEACTKRRGVRRERAGARPSAARRGYGHRWRKVREGFLRANPLCVECLAEGRHIAATDADHIVSRADGGADSWDNLQALCHAHHSRKTVRQDGGFGRQRSEVSP